jgi:site-specific DNA recombinase
MRAGLYARVSREEQAEGYSIDAQLDAMRRFCRDRGWTIAGEYIEPGVSGTTRNRPAFQKVLSDAEQGKLDVLLTHQLDRFYRNLLEQLQTLGQLGQWGVGYLSVTEQIDYSTPQGKLFLSMLGAFNEYYVANLSRLINRTYAVTRN